MNKISKANILKKLGSRTFMITLPGSADPFVLKISPPGRLQTARFVTGCTLWSTIRHSSFPALVETGKFNGDSYYAISEFINGESLERIYKRKCADENDCIGYLYELANIIDFLHSRNPPVLYCDLKPGNIIKKNDGKLALIDPELLINYIHGDKILPARGTPGYSPPEQYRGIVDQRSDIYSLGISILKLLTGGIFLSEPDYVNPETGILTILRKAINYDPYMRFQTARELIKEIEKLMNEKDIHRFSMNYGTCTQMKN